MTNSIATAKCPSVLTSGNYGMSQNRCTDETKEYIFVKLTDSAYRAVEEYQRNENAKRFANGQRAKIQFNGNSGIIHVPTPDSAEGRKFGFAIDDVEGSLECIQQTQHDLDVLGSLAHRMRIQANDDIYDTTRTKMAIAEETEKSKCIREIKPNQTDIGRKVKKPAAAASNFQHHHHNSNSNSGNNSNNTNNNSSSNNYLSSSNNRSKLATTTMCNSPPLNGAGSGSGSGTGLTMTQTASSMKLGMNSASSRSPNPTLLGGSGTISSSNNRYGNHNSTNNSSSTDNLYAHNNGSTSLSTLSSASSLSSTLAGGIANGYASTLNGSSPNEFGKTKMGSGNAHFLGSSVGNGGGGGGGGGSVINARGSKGLAKGSAGIGGGAKNSTGASGGNKLPDISRRKIRERLIHLLALKPFKKPELYSRLQNEGLRDRERSLISNILKDISTMSRDNTYNLRRQMWNDVNENWPYYTEQELQQLKRRKPQNLTPPLSSDAGSSTSGQSPTSTHTGSPPQLVGNGGGNGGFKRASLESYEDPLLCGAQPKKQRISHFKKDAIAMAGSSNVSGSNSSSAAPRMAYGGSNNYVPPNRNPMVSSYSPHGVSHGVSSGMQQATDDNSGNSDLSYNVLDNVEDFMPNVEQNSCFGNVVVGSNGRKSANATGSSGNKAANAKEKRSSSTTTLSGSGPTERSSNKELMKKSSSSSALSAAYGGSFLPESKSNSRSGSSVSSGINLNNNNNNVQRKSPSYAQQQQQHHKTNNSVIFSPKTQAQSSPRDEFNATANRNGNSNSNGGSSSNGRYQQTAARSSTNKLAANARTSTPPIQPRNNHNQYYHQQQQQQQQPPSLQHQQQQELPLQQQQQQQPPATTTSTTTITQTSQHSSPTQQIAAAVSTYTSSTDASATNADAPRYNFSNYTPIASIEQRRRYKTEFESDYDEYLKLLSENEAVKQRFTAYAETLKQVREGCPDFYNIKQKIVDEYTCLQNEDTIRRKQRFDYLHAKLAHIKKLVSDYDETLTAVAVAAAHQKNVNHHHQRHGHRDAAATAAADTSLNILATSHSARVSPMGESNHSPPNSQHQQQHHHLQQQHQHLYNQQQHDAETIQQQHHATTQLHGTRSPLPPSNKHNNASNNNNNNNTANTNHGNDTNSDDSSDSDSNDDDDDDENDDSNSNSNDDDDDDDDDNEPY